jgi:hypothetical protein
MGRHFGDTIRANRKGVVGEHGQGFLVLVPGVRGARNPCPYEGNRHQTDPVLPRRPH